MRGAPAIGQVAAIGLALTADKARTTRPYARRATLRGATNALINARPTAVNLRWAVDRHGRVRGRRRPVRGRRRHRRRDPGRGRHDHLRDDRGPRPAGRRSGSRSWSSRRTGRCGSSPIATRARSPAASTGPALGIVQAAHHAGRAVHVWVDETRPYLQGARLTAWELAQAEVPHTLIPDVAAGHLMARGEVDVVIVGGDRVAANGDTANKLGTYTLAVLAARHGIPFYVGRADQHGRPRDAGWRRDPDRGARRQGGPVRPWRADRPDGDRGPQPVVRRHAGRPDHRHRHRRGRDPGARTARAWPRPSRGANSDAPRHRASVRSSRDGRARPPAADAASADAAEPAAVES